MKIFCTENQVQIAESIEFDAVKGKGVDSENSKNGSNYTKEVDKKIKAFNNGLQEEYPTQISENDVTEDGNRVCNKGMERLKYDTKPSKEFKDRVEAQMLGKPSAIAEDGDEANATTDGNKNYLKQSKELNKFDNNHTGVGKDNNALIQLGDDIEVLQGTKPKTKLAAFESHSITKTKEEMQHLISNIRPWFLKVYKDFDPKIYSGGDDGNTPIPTQMAIDYLHANKLDNKISEYMPYILDHFEDLYELVLKHRHFNIPMFKENKVKRLNYKKSTFLNEEHIISLIPDTYKINENKFIMKDKLNQEFIVEWKNDKANIITENKFPKQINEEINKIKKLYNYNSSYYYNNRNNSGRGVDIDMKIFKK